MRRIGKILLDIAIYALIVGGLVWGLPKGLSWALETPYPMATITSGSMWPALHEGDLIFIQSIPKEDVMEGDIIVWRNPSGNGFTIHRVVRLGEDTFVTKGDANFNEDEPIEYGNIIGEAYAVTGKTVRLPYIGLIAIKANQIR